MNREERNIGSIIIFISIIIIIGVGGHYLISKNINKPQNNNNNNNTISSIKIDDKKSYIYFTNEVVYDEHENIVYKDININIDTAEAIKLQEKLNQETATIKNEIQKDEKGEVTFAKLIEYSVAETSKYVSLTVNNYVYKADSSEDETVDDSKLTYYVFDIESGHILSNRDILKKENVTDQDVRAKIREYINNDENVDIDATLNNDYYLSISKTGKIVINTIVKSSNSNYNVSIEME